MGKDVKGRVRTQQAWRNLLLWQRPFIVPGIFNGIKCQIFLYNIKIDLKVEYEVKMILF